MMPPPFTPPAAASGRRPSPPSPPRHSHTPLKARPFCARAQSTGAVVGMAVGIPVGVILLAICVFCVLKSCGKKEDEAWRRASPACGPSGRGTAGADQGQVEDVVAGRRL